MESVPAIALQSVWTDPARVAPGQTTGRAEIQNRASGHLVAVRRFVKSEKIIMISSDTNGEVALKAVEFRERSQARCRSS